MFYLFTSSLAILAANGVVNYLRLSICHSDYIYKKMTDIALAFF
jgi:hypothetical protein